MLELLDKSEKAKSICKGMWDNKKLREDPCDECLLYKPCIRQGGGEVTAELFNNWIRRINDLAEVL